MAGYLGERSARRLLRQKYGRHDEFYGRINYPPHSIHLSPMQTVFTDAAKVAGFIIQRGRIGFEAFTTDEKSAGAYETHGIAGVGCGPPP